MKNLNYLPQLFIAFLAVLMLGCQPSPSEEDYFIEDEGGERLSYTVLNTDSAGPVNFCYLAIDNKLIQLLYGDTHSYAVYNIEGDRLQYEGKFMQKGNGPYELKVAKLKYRPDKKELIIYSKDAAENDCYRVDLNNFENLYNPRSWEKEKLPALPTRDCLEFAGDSAYLHNSYSKENSLFSIAYYGQENCVKELNFPYPVAESDALLRYTLFFGDLIRHPSKSKFVYSSEFFKYLILFNLEKEEITNVRNLSSILPDYKPTSGNPYQLFTLDKDLQRGCMDILVTERYIYIGYNHMTWREIRDKKTYKGYPDTYYDRINVFDWDGNFVKRLILEKPVYCFSVSQDDTYLYASSIDLTQENQPDQVLRFELKGL